MPIPGRNWKPKRSGSNAPYYYTEDTGCKYSNGKGCLECPFRECLEKLTWQERALVLAGVAEPTSSTKPE